MNQDIRNILEQFGKLSTPVTSLSDDASLYDAGLTSFASVQLMLGLEEKFDVEFPERMLNRRTFSSIASIEAALRELFGEKIAS